MHTESHFLSFPVYSLMDSKEKVADIKIPRELLTVIVLNELTQIGQCSCHSKLQSCSLITSVSRPSTEKQSLQTHTQSTAGYAQVRTAVVFNMAHRFFNACRYGPLKFCAKNK